MANAKPGADAPRFGLILVWAGINRVMDTVFRYMGAFGVIRGPLLYLLSVAWPPSKGRLCGAAVPGAKAKVFLRLGTSDISVFNGIFRWQEYAWDLERQPRSIIDAGAYTGLSAIYFSMRYPGARVIAVEASESNFSLLVRNTAAWVSIEPVHAALWWQPASLVVTDPGTGAWGLQVRNADSRQADSPVTGADSTGGSVRAITISDLVRDYDLARVDLLKLDIEGSEKELFSHPAPWLDEVDAICVELHDWFKAGCSRAFFEAVREFRVETWRGENVLVARAASAVRTLRPVTPRCPGRQPVPDAASQPARWRLAVGSLVAMPRACGGYPARRALCAQRASRPCTH